MPEATVSCSEYTDVSMAHCRILFLDIVDIVLEEFLHGMILVKQYKFTTTKIYWMLYWTHYCRRSTQILYLEYLFFEY